MNGRQQREEQFVRLEAEDGGIAWIWLDRPDSLNAIGAASRAQLDQALRAVERDDSVRCLVLIGTGRAFCAGEDVFEITDPKAGGAAEEMARVQAEEFGPMIVRMRRMPKPVIAGLNGVAAGIGASLAMAADIRIAVPEAAFVQAFINLGLGPVGGATWLLPRLVPPARALEMMLSGRRVDSAEAERWGLINQIVPSGQLEQTVRAIATLLAAGPTKAIAATKRAFNHALESRLEEALWYEACLQEVQAGGEDFREGVAAFVEKRAANFKGR
jgi:2-(1,2-epoxy-1,2-dihydrophenyl)acetyl-CoA isomerase